MLGAVPGIALAIVIAVIEFLWDGWRPHSAVLGRVEGMKGYHDIARHPDARQIPGLVLFRWDAPPCSSPTRNCSRSGPSTRWPTRRYPFDGSNVAAEPVTSVDVTAADGLDELHAKLDAAGIRLCFAEMKGPVKDKLKRFGLFAQLGEESFFPTVGAAVSGYLKAFPLDWVDWEDRGA